MPLDGLNCETENGQRAVPTCWFNIGVYLEIASKLPWCRRYLPLLLYRTTAQHVPLSKLYVYGWIR